MGEVLVTPTKGMAAPDTDGVGQTCKHENAAKEQRAGNTLSDYYQLLQDSRCFRIIWIGEVCITLGISCMCPYAPCSSSLRKLFP